MIRYQTLSQLHGNVSNRTILSGEISFELYDLEWRNIFRIVRSPVEKYLSNCTISSGEISFELYNLEFEKYCNQLAAEENGEISYTGTRRRNIVHWYQKKKYRTLVPEGESVSPMTNMLKIF
jgi:hypothetical protein